MSKQTPHIIISRTDGIGDVMLTLPLAGWLKQHLPDCRIDMLVRRYTAPIAAHCSHIDTVLLWDEAVPEYQETLRQTLRHATVIIHALPHFAIAQLAHHIGIAERIGTSHRWYHWFTCNRLVSLGRKNSPLHEAQLNCRLAEPLLGTQALPALQDIPPLYGFSASDTTASFSSIADTTTDVARTIILHPRSQGSAPRWSVMHWCILAEMLCEQGWKVIITGSKAEGEQLHELFAMLARHQEQGQVVNLCGALTLDELIALIAKSDALVAASTGPLHIASALGIKAIGLYVTRRPLHAGRWGALGTKARIIERGKPSCASCTAEECACISRITPDDILAMVEEE